MTMFALWEASTDDPTSGKIVGCFDNDHLDAHPDDLKFPILAIPDSVIMAQQIGLTHKVVSGQIVEI